MSELLVVDVPDETMYLVPGLPAGDQYGMVVPLVDMKSEGGV